MSNTRRKFLKSSVATVASLSFWQMQEREASATTPSATMNSFYSYQCNFDNQSVSSWTTYGGTWSIIDQKSSYYYRVDSTSCDKAVTIVPTMTDFTVEGLVQIRNSTGQGSLIFGVANPSTGCDNFKGYVAGINTNGTVWLGKENKGYTQIASASRTITANVPYHVRAVRSGSNIKVYVNGYLYIDAKDSTFTSCKMIGVRGGFGNRVQFTAIKMQAYPEPSVTPASKLSVFTYQNPNKDVIIRDPEIRRVGDTYYMTGTGPVFWVDSDVGAGQMRGGINPGVPLYSSKNLIDWKFEKTIIERDTTFTDLFWASDLQYINHKYYVTTFSGNNSGLFCADNILGPYTCLTPGGIPGLFDPCLFQDDDGKTYMTYNSIYIAQIDLSNGKFVGEPWKACSYGPPGSWDSGMEGSYLIKRNGLYYFMYSGTGIGYQVGIATATNIHGPWTKAAKPVYGASPGDGSPFSAAGHNAIFTGPDGRDWICCLGILNTGNNVAHCVMDPVLFQNGTMTSAHEPEKPTGPTWRVQNIPINGSSTTGRIQR